MTQQEYETLTRRSDFARANAVYMVLPNLNKHDFCLLWALTDGDLPEFKQAEELTNGRLDAGAVAMLYRLENDLECHAAAARAELMNPANWTARARRAARKAIEEGVER